MLDPGIVELIIESSTAVAVMLLRFAIRLRTPGWRHLDGTDVWCLLSSLFYIGFTVCTGVLHLPAYEECWGYMGKPLDEIPHDMQVAIVQVSKFAYVSWIVYICMVFAFKGVPLRLLWGISTSINYHRTIVLCTTVFTMLAWVASLLAHMLACLPLSKNWQIYPRRPPECSARALNYWVTGTLNPITDLFIMLIPMPLLFKLNVSLYRKIPLILLFGSGIFIITCTVLRNYFVLGVSNNNNFALTWAGREGFVSMLVISAPGIWGLVQTHSWFRPSPHSTGLDNQGSELAPKQSSPDNPNHSKSDDEMELFDSHSLSHDLRNASTKTSGEDHVQVLYETDFSKEDTKVR